MYPMHVVVELDQELHEKMQKVAESLGIPIEPPAEMVELVLDVLVEDHYLDWIARAERATIPAEELKSEDVARAVDGLSSPQIAREVHVVPTTPGTFSEAPLLHDIWDRLEKRHAGSAAMNAVLGMGEDQELWKKAYTTVYLAGELTGDANRQWTLIESTYRMYKRRQAPAGG